MRAHRELSGPAWCAQYPTDRTTASLVQPFRRNVQRFITAIERAGCTVRISATRRPAERAWLMRCAWDIANKLVRPQDIERRDDILIDWTHGSEKASIDAARAMCETYELAHRPSLTSRHIEGRAIDMTIDRPAVFAAVDGKGRTVRVSSLSQLYVLGATYGVHKLTSDPPHWSDDGR